MDHDNDDIHEIMDEHEPDIQKMIHRANMRADARWISKATLEQFTKVMYHFILGK